MRLNKPLNKILNTETKIKVLRFFCSAGGEITGRQVAKLLKVASTPVQAALRDLYNEGILDRKGFGRAFAYQLNQKNWVVESLLKPLFRSEGEYPSTLWNKIREKLENSNQKKHILSVVLFGSVGSAQERPTSDIDLLVVIQDNADKEIIEDLFIGMNRDIIQETGLNIDARIYSVAEFKDKRTEGITFIKTAIRSHTVIFGKGLETFS